MVIINDSHILSLSGEAIRTKQPKCISGEILYNIHIEYTIKRGTGVNKIFQSGKRSYRYTDGLYWVLLLSQCCCKII